MIKKSIKDYIKNITKNSPDELFLVIYLIYSLIDYLLDFLLGFRGNQFIIHLLTYILYSRNLFIVAIVRHHYYNVKNFYMCQSIIKIPLYYLQRNNFLFKYH